ncbi:hypothetical protein GE21DRAFT_3228 [Neurospora crassa]|uniref:Uncharacterized protein n=1 Tax=Neurospora crassa (strain ATCC 24698 / 74-OR23-1A / CBS 708.71 / DSM 1257 / FGSC 987) TaxID=367110 RepID=V5IR24_NEUCR|nr:hypothetical protein NCU16557 [Neurospora crassa OR74A]ESA43606.1 hypothetical protein NCU16557 [Neurospora crassa OR74A]KHE78805.1 hypothetical protein GE21DRAFT_3228 [Neurospora crassa]|eukprot:XP_011393693.1 hypothetical protein NCU16557 [Neurospora crassa OR74A]
MNSMYTIERNVPFASQSVNRLLPRGSDQGWLPWARTETNGDDGEEEEEEEEERGQGRPYLASMGTRPAAPWPPFRTPGWLKVQTVRVPRPGPRPSHKITIPFWPAWVVEAPQNPFPGSCVPR